MRDTILVLTNSEDGEHTESVISEIKRMKQKVFRLDIDRLAKGEIKISCQIDGDNFLFRISDNKNCIKSDEIMSIWYRRPLNFQMEINDPVQREYAEKELTNFLEGLWFATNNVFWLNNPLALVQARKKILQLRIAKELEFLVPPTIVTNNPEEVLDFISVNGETVFKAIQEEFLEYEKEAFNIPTTLLTSDLISQLDTIQNTPALFQKFIDKSYELRVTIVGDKIFPVKIESMEYSETSVDWRHPDFITKLKHSIVKIPEDIEIKCLKMMQKLGLSFGAFDFVVDKDGLIYFLEVNPNGQWYWIEHLTKAQIAKAIAITLIKK